MDARGLVVASVAPPEEGAAADIRSFDWAQTSLGPMNRWPQCLRSAVNVAVGSPFPIVIFCGSDLRMIYNDDYRELISSKHPTALGAPAQRVWAEVWDDVGPMLESVLRTGEAARSDDLRLLLDHQGRAEERYFSLSCSSILDERRRVAGVFTLVTETTEKVLGERRLRTLHDLGVQAARSEDAAGACSVAAAVLKNNPHDVPFALFYLVDTQRSGAWLAASTDVPRGADFAVEFVSLSGDETADCQWLVSQVLRTGKPALVEVLPGHRAALAIGSEPALPGSALTLPILLPGQHKPTGALVCALNPHQRLDPPYREFLELLAAQVATMVADQNARAGEGHRPETQTALGDIRSDSDSPQVFSTGSAFVEEALRWLPAQAQDGQPDLF